MSGAVAGRECETCYGQGDVPTDEGPVPCPDCGGAGTLPPPDTLVEWRLRAIERVHGSPGDGMGRDIDWLAFELRNARAALTELLALTDELEETAVRTRMRFVCNRALSLYDLTAVDKESSSK